MIESPEYTISVLCHNRIQMTDRCLRSVLQHSPPQTEVIVTDNASTDGTAELLVRYASENPRIRIITKPFNEGVGGPKREVCEQARAPYFVSLDNDAWVGDGWLEMLRAPLNGDPNVMQVGLEGRHQTLGGNGDGYPGGVVEYIDGSCFMVRTAIANELGLCDHYFPFAYGDDSDFSLRLRARGYAIATTRASVTHLDGEHNKAGHGGVDLGPHHARNRGRFVRRWADYLRRRAFDPTIAIRRTAALGDVVIASALPKRLKRLWPHSRIFFATKLPAVFEANPHLEGVISEHEFLPLAQKMAYAWDLDLAYEAVLSRPYWKSYADATIFSTDEPTPAPDLYPPAWAKAEADSLLDTGRPIAVVCATPTGWPGKDASPAIWGPALTRLRSSGYAVVEIGLGSSRFNGSTDRNLTGRTPFPILAAIMARARVFLGLDSGPFHVAQGMGVPSVIVFGCTDPARIATRPELLVPVQASGLDCLGCHHGRPPGTTSFQGCARGDLACMAIGPGHVLLALERAEAIAEALGR